jgi:hypothetical protein
MRKLLFFLLSTFFLFSCKKEKFTSEPHLTFLSLTPDSWSSNNPDPNAGPVLSMQLTDAEGDLGFQDTSLSFVYVKNITVPPFETDSFAFPSLPLSDKTNLNVQLDVRITDCLAAFNLPRPHTDTLFFEVYVKDFANNKSNVITTPQPVYYTSP